MFDISTVPFSRAGSWLSLALRGPSTGTGLTPGLFLRANRGRPIMTRELFQLEAIEQGVAVTPSIEASEALLRLTCPAGGIIEIVLEGVEGCRMRGRGCSIRFCAVEGEAYPNGIRYPVVAYASVEGGWVVNLRRNLRRYAFHTLSGQIEASHVWDGEHSRAVLLLCSGTPDWEVRIDGFQSTWRPGPETSFDAVVRDAQSDFARFLHGVPTVAPPLEDVGRNAGHLLWSCLKPPLGLLRRHTILMSLNWMDAVWSWDNLFNALCLMPGQPDLAEDQIRCVTDHQDEFGAYPDHVSDLYRHFNFSKPPVQGVLFTEALSRFPQWWTEPRRRWILDSVGRFTRWWLTHRQWKGLDLAYYLHGNDSGWDNSSLLRQGTPLVSPDLNAFLVRQCGFLAELARSLQRPAEAAEWLQEQERLRTALMTHLWRKGQFVALKMPEGEPVPSLSLVATLPLVIADLLPPHVTKTLVEQLRSFLTDWGLATERVDSPFYASDGYWRGPIWGPSTYLAVLGLRRAGEPRLAADVAARFCRLCARSGFAENFDALTGRPLRDPAYTWTASSFLLLASELVPNDETRPTGRDAEDPLSSEPSLTREAAHTAIIASPVTS